MITHVLFDFFGTLVEYSPSRTEQGYARSHDVLTRAGARLSYDDFLALWVEVSEELDRRAEATHREFSMLELGMAFLGRVPGVEASWPLADRFVETYVDEWSRGVRPIEGIRELLLRLREAGLRVGLVTNTHSGELVRRHARAMGIEDLFHALVTSVEHGLRKPHPAIFRDALSATGGDPRRAVYVGDSYEPDYEGARRAGLEALLIDPGGQSRVPREHRLDSVLDLPSRLFETARSRSARGGS